MFNNLQKPFVLVVCLFVSANAHAGKWVNWGKVTSDVSDVAHAGVNAVSNGVDTVVDSGRAAVDTVVDKGRGAVDTVVEAGKDVKDSVVEKKNQYAAERAAKKAAQ